MLPPRTISQTTHPLQMSNHPSDITFLQNIIQLTESFVDPSPRSPNKPRHRVLVLLPQPCQPTCKTLHPSPQQIVGAIELDKTLVLVLAFVQTQALATGPALPAFVAIRLTTWQCPWGRVATLVLLLVLLRSRWWLIIRLSLRRCLCRVSSLVHLGHANLQRLVFISARLGTEVVSAITIRAQPIAS